MKLIYAHYFGDTMIETTHLFKENKNEMITKYKILTDYVESEECLPYYDMYNRSRCIVTVTRCNNVFRIFVDDKYCDEDEKYILYEHNFYSTIMGWAINDILTQITGIIVEHTEDCASYIRDYCNAEDEEYLNFATVIDSIYEWWCMNTKPSEITDDMIREDVEQELIRGDDYYVYFPHSVEHYLNQLHVAQDRGN